VELIEIAPRKPTGFFNICIECKRVYDDARKGAVTAFRELTSWDIDCLSLGCMQPCASWARNRRPWVLRLIIANLGPLLRPESRRRGEVARFLVWLFRPLSGRRRCRLPKSCACGNSYWCCSPAARSRARAMRTDSSGLCANRWFAGWRNWLLIVKPETMLRWHRRGWRLLGLAIINGTVDGQIAPTGNR